MIMSVEKHLVNLAFSKYEWGYPFDLAFPKGRYSDSERAHLKIGWDKAERYHWRLQCEKDAADRKYREELEAADAIEKNFETAKKELFELFGDKYARAVEAYLEALLEKRDHDKERK